MSETDTDSDAAYTVVLNGKKYELNREMRETIQERAKHEFSENSMFSCWWKVASPDQYADGEWDETIHEAGDPVLVIETEGPYVPWDKMDQLNVEMQEVGSESQFDGVGSDDDSKQDELDNGNGLRTIDPDDVDEAEKEIGRTHFALTPQQFEEVPSPDGEEPDKIPAKPERMGDEPALITWVPNYPDIEHTWSAGEAIAPMHSRVEWNVQVKADQPRPSKEKDDSHDHWESLVKSMDCGKVGELAPSQGTPSSSQSKDKDVPKKFEDGTAGGNNWAV